MAQEWYKMAMMKSMVTPVENINFVLFNLCSLKRSNSELLGTRNISSVYPHFTALITSEYRMTYSGIIITLYPLFH